VCECALALGNRAQVAQAFATLSELLAAPDAAADALHRPPALYRRAAAVARQLAPEQAGPLEQAARRLLDVRAATIDDAELSAAFRALPDHAELATE